MHKVFPTAVSFAAGGQLNDHTFEVSKSPLVFFSHWFSKPEWWEDDSSRESVWLEHRRKDFSDVCHAKVVSSENLFNEQIGRGIILDAPTSRLVAPHAESCWYSGNPSSCTMVHYVGESNGFYSVTQRVYMYWDRSRTRITLGHAWAYSTVDHWQSGGTQPVVRFDKGYSSATYQIAYHSFSTTSCSGHLDFRESIKAWIQSYFYDGCDGTEDFLRPIAEYLGPFLWHLLIHDFRVNGKRILGKSTRRVVGTTRLYTAGAERYELGEDTFLLHEPDVIMRHTEDVLLGPGFQAYNRNVLIENSYLDALQNVPRLSENSISNILEITSFIKSLVVDHRIEMPKTLQDAWLAYRYSYSTTKADAEEAIRFVHRHMDLGDWDHLKVHGVYRKEISDGVVATCRTVLTVTPKELPTLQRIWRSLYTYGLTPSFYVVWDMIPYSFIVDWFLPVGNVLSAWDAEREFQLGYDMSDYNQSISYSVPTKVGTVRCYTRWYAPPPKRLHGYYFLESTASNKTIVKRVLDSVSLITG